MTNSKKPKLTIVQDSNLNPTQTEQLNNITLPQNHEPKTSIQSSGGSTNYHTNPMYEKLLKFREQEKKKRFTVEDLLKW